MQLSVKVTQNEIGALVPSPVGQGLAYVSINNNATPKTAIVSFFGMNQAVLSFDDFGTKALNYSLLNPMASLADQVSIENIIEHLNNNMMG